MKHSINHLPKIKQDELEKIVAMIQENCNDVEKIILFGSYARGDYKEKKDLDPRQKTGHISDYDLLVVTEKKATTDQFVSWNHTDKLNLSAPVRIIACDIQALNISLAEGQYLFSDIKKEGIILYDSKKHQLANQRDLTPQEKQRIAKDYFDHWFRIAKGFYKHFEIDFAEIDVNKNTEANGLAAFHLHQAAEHCYKTILLVFTNYNPQEHYLGILGQAAAKYQHDLLTLFPKTTQKEGDRFKLLDYAYIGGRYDPDYRISKEDLEILAKDVKKLLVITEDICLAKVKSFVEKSII
jgi:predicted nucleotidyltransferase/HEPN domain-containing protein